MANLSQALVCNRFMFCGFFLGVLLLFPYRAFADSLSVTSTMGAAGSTVSVSAVADVDKTVHAIQFTLKFDPNLLTLSAVKTGGNNASWVLVYNPKIAGEVIVGMFNPGQAGMTIKGLNKQIANLSFIVNKTAAAHLTSSTLILSKVSFDTENVTQLNAGKFTLTGNL